MTISALTVYWRQHSGHGLEGDTRKSQGTPYLAGAEHGVLKMECIESLGCGANRVYGWGDTGEIRVE